MRPLHSLPSTVSIAPTAATPPGHSLAARLSEKGGHSAGHVKALEVGLSDSCLTSHGTGVPGNMPRLEPRLYPEGHTMRKNIHRLENLTPSSKGPTSPPRKTTVQQEPDC